MIATFGISSFTGFIARRTVRAFASVFLVVTSSDGRNAPVMFGSFPPRALVFTLAFLSFACLLGQFYGVWTMRSFGCWVLPPAVALLTTIAILGVRAGSRLRMARMWIVQGALGGILAAFAYDLFRLPFVLAGAPLFNVFPRFGELLLGATEPRWLVHALGWSYHFSNGSALGIMFLALVARPTPPVLFWGAVAWAMLVEVMLLLTPYARFFGLPLDAQFIALTVSAHLVFGIALGLWCARRVSEPRPLLEPGAPV